MLLWRSQLWHSGTLLSRPQADRLRGVLRVAGLSRVWWWHLSAVRVALVSDVVVVVCDQRCRGLAWAVVVRRLWHWRSALARRVDVMQWQWSEHQARQCSCRGAEVAARSFIWLALGVLLLQPPVRCG